MCGSDRAVLEIAVQDPAGAKVASGQGAYRVELCVGLGAYGGFTPSIGLVQEVCRVGLPGGVQVLVRPRAGDFHYTDPDLVAVQVNDIRALVRAGAAGVVIGALDGRGDVDRELSARLLEAAREEADRQGRPIQVTCHRAFDQVPDRSAALETLIDLGFDRVLTSGGAPSVGQGMDAIADLVQQADGRIQIMAGGGLRVEDIGRVLDLGVDAVHMSATRLVDSRGGPGAGADAGLEITDGGLVGQAAQAVSAWHSAAGV